LVLHLRVSTTIAAPGRGDLERPEQSERQQRNMARHRVTVLTLRASRNVVGTMGGHDPGMMEPTNADLSW